MGEYPHKFVNNKTDNTYAQLVWCGKCGLIAFHSNQTAYYKDKQKEILELSCPYPDKEEVKLDDTIKEIK